MSLLETGTVPLTNSRLERTMPPPGSDRPRFAAFANYPRLAERALVLPGNHDINVVDRANPARLDLPTSPGKRLRQMRTLSAIAAVQGDRVRMSTAWGGSAC